jgi:uncharacterized protein
VTAQDAAVYSAGGFRPFRAAGHDFAYLVPSGGIFELSPAAAAALQCVEGNEVRLPDLLDAVKARGFSEENSLEAVEELLASRALEARESRPAPAEPPPADFPLQTLVLNLTNQCNLSCQYCYEYGADKVATPEGKPKFMDFETAMASVNFLLEQSAGRKQVHITFFGGETLMNFPLLRRVVQYANQRAASEGRAVDFSLTTNATLLTPAIVEFLSENRIGVTVSMDGPKELHDKLRVFANGRGSYAVIEPRVRELIRSHRTRPITARVTLTSEVTDVLAIFRHLKNDLGFHEVGFAPATTSPNRLYTIGERGMDHVLEQFRLLAEEYLEFALRGEWHGFSNVSDTLAELHRGVSKSHPCGAGLGLVGVGPSGDIAPCHRFVDSDQHALGHLSTGIDRAKQGDFLRRGHVQNKYECQTCWARPLCAGGCHHEAFVRYGDTGHPNLHYCDWIRDWTDTCLRIYGAIAVTRPDFLNYFAERKAQ